MAFYFVDMNEVDKMKRIVRQSLLFSLIVHLLYLAGTIGLGYIKTIYYVPDVVNAYQEVQYLQNEIAFGVISRPLNPVQFGFISFMITSVLFIAIKMFWVKRRFRN